MDDGCPHDAKKKTVMLENESLGVTNKKIYIPFRIEFIIISLGHTTMAIEQAS